MEILTQLISPVSPSFTPKAAIKKLPIFSGITQALQSMYVERAGTDEERN